MSDLPAGWRRTTLRELSAGGLFTDGDWIESKDQDPSGSIRLTQLADVGVGAFRDRSDRWLRTDQAAKLGVTYLQPDDVLIARMPDPIGRACLVPRGLGEAVTVVDVAVLRPRPYTIEPRFLMWAINDPRFTAEVSGLQAGTTRKRISRKNLATLSIDFPTLSEQRRIVGIIEEHLSRLDAANRYLGRSEDRSSRLVEAACHHALQGSGSRSCTFDDLLFPATPPRATVKAGNYLAVGTWPVVDQGAGATTFYTNEASAVYRGELPVLIFGDHTRRVKLTRSPFAVGAQGTKLLNARLGVDPMFAYWSMKGVRLASRGYGRHYSRLRATVFQTGDENFQRRVIESMEKVAEQAAQCRRQIKLLQPRQAALRRALLTAAFSGRLTGRSTDTEVVEEIADSQVAS